jgi:hypothetical protein
MHPNKSELLRTVQLGLAVPRIWRVFPRWPAISHARDCTTDRKAALKFPNSSLKPATVMSFLWRRP